MRSRVAISALASAILESALPAKNESQSAADVAGLRPIHSVIKVMRNRHNAGESVVQISTVAATHVKNTVVQGSARQSSGSQTNESNVR
jgi:hypothetical protein